TSSRSVNVWAATLSSACSSGWPASYTGMTTETRGATAVMRTMTVPGTHARPPAREVAHSAPRCDDQRAAAPGPCTTFREVATARGCGSGAVHVSDPASLSTANRRATAGPVGDACHSAAGGSSRHPSPRGIVGARDWRPLLAGPPGWIDRQHFDGYSAGDVST